MSLGTIYTKIAAGEAVRTRVLLPESLIKYFKIDVKVSDPDEVFPAKFPMKLVPAFQFPDGTLLSESLPINLFLLQQVENHGGLLGDNSQKAWAQNLQWMEFFNNDFMRPSGLLFGMIVGRKPFNKDVYNFFYNHLRDVAMPIIEQQLGQTEYLTGPRSQLPTFMPLPCSFVPSATLWTKNGAGNCPRPLPGGTRLLNTQCLTISLLTLKWSKNSPRLAKHYRSYAFSIAA